MVHPNNRPLPTNCPRCAGRKNSNSNLCPNHFRDLKKLWYKKIEAKGFDDIEQEHDGLLRSWSSNSFSRRGKGETYEDRQVHYTSIEDYYRLAGNFLHEYEFGNAFDSAVWKYHSEGFTIKEIVHAIKKSRIGKREAVHKNKVYKTIHRLCEQMMSKYLTK